jgi:hypothetical protein
LFPALVKDRLQAAMPFRQVAQGADRMLILLSISLTISARVSGGAPRLPPSRKRQRISFYQLANLQDVGVFPFWRKITACLAGTVDEQLHGILVNGFASVRYRPGRGQFLRF